MNENENQNQPAAGRGVAAPSDAQREDMAAILMRRWGCEDDDQGAYDAACGDVDALTPLFAEVYGSTATPEERFAAAARGVMDAVRSGTQPEPHLCVQPDGTLAGCHDRHARSWAT